MSSPANDPRQPSTAKPYKPAAVAPQDLPIDYSGFIAVVFGVFGAMFRVSHSPYKFAFFQIYYDFI